MKDINSWAKVQFFGGLILSGILAVIAIIRHFL